MIFIVDLNHDLNRLKSWI